LTAVILQPSYLPWRGYFDLMHRADVFVHYDDVQYTRQDWRSRNRIRVPGGVEWLTIPVENAGFLTSKLLIKDARVHWGRDWTRSHRDRIVRSYKRTPYFARYFPAIDASLSAREELLVAYTIPLVERLAAELGIASRTVRSSELGVAEQDPTRRLVRICEQLGADRYLSGPSAKDYLDEPQFTSAGIALEYMEYRYPAYEQIDDRFVPDVSVIDLLFMKGERAPDYIWG
jgi:WbqC-like protein family